MDYRVLYDQFVIKKKPNPVNSPTALPLTMLRKSYIFLYASKISDSFLTHVLSTWCPCSQNILSPRSLHGNYLTPEKSLLKFHFLRDWPTF